MKIQIQTTRPEDLPAIFSLYTDAIALQKEIGNNNWLGFEADLVSREIEENRHYTITAGKDIIATFCITLTDPVIWPGPNDIPAVYIHRIAVSARFRGNGLLRYIIEWAREYAVRHALDSIRMDTGSGNDRLINYYLRNGFMLIGETTIADAPDLPAHYKNATFALLQMAARG